MATPTARPLPERAELHRLVDVLPADIVALALELLKTLRESSVPSTAVQEIELKRIPAGELLKLAGIVSLGGDALEDSEALYDGSD